MTLSPVTLINNLVTLSLSKDHHDKPFVTLINNLVTLSLACPELVEGKSQHDSLS